MSITAAAERLNISQPSVSIAIKELEAFYSTSLFDRINRKIYLTEAGTLLRQYSDSIIEQYDKAISNLRSGKAFTECKLGVNISFAETYLPKIICEINSSLPECSLSVTVQNNEQLDSMLADNQIDFAVYDGVTERTTKNTELLFTEEMVAVCSPSVYDKDIISLEELSSRPLLLREKGSGARSFTERAFSSKGLSKKIAVESSSTLSLLELSRSGIGFSVIPFTLAKTVCDEIELKTVKIDSENINRYYHLAYNERKHLTDTMLKLKNIICNPIMYNDI